MKTKRFFISSLLLLGVWQTVDAQSNEKKALQGIAARKEKREKQVALLHANVAEQKVQLAFEKPVAGESSLPNNGNGSGQRVDVTLPPKANGTPPAKKED